MPELPEVEVVRRGLALGVAGRHIAAVTVSHPRTIRRHELGAADFAGRLAGRRIGSASRRGKYLWLTLEPNGDEGLMAHLGMSGQLLLVTPDTPTQPHLRARFTFTDAGLELRFVDQRTFGGLALVPLTADGAGGAIPLPVAHIARDPLDPLYDPAQVTARMRRRRTGLKRALLDQTLVSGVGNIYADESLWRARLHGARPTETLTERELARLWAAVDQVLIEALDAGGTSFDALYVSTEGASGLFERELAVYGRAGEPCPRCGALIRRDAFMNRSSFTCPRCQPRPRRARG